MSGGTRGSRRYPSASRLGVLLAAVVGLFGLVFGTVWTVGTPAGATTAQTPATPGSRAHIDAGPGSGYWEVASDGGIFAFGDAAFYGSTGAITLNKPIVGMAATPDGKGYWLVASDGGIFAFGDAAFYGSTGGIALAKPIVGMAATPDGKGYWLVAADGGIFAFGDAAFYGSTGGIALAKPIVGMAATPDGKGYWLVASDGGIFAFGDAGFHGSTGGIALVKPVVGMAATQDGKGYWLVASDGGIFAFGDAAFYGSMGGVPLNKPVVGIAATLDGLGYWEVASDGGLFAFGDAPFYGSTGGMTLNKPIVGMAAVPNTGTKISPTNITGVSCPTTTWCQAVDGAGNVITYANGTWSTPLLVDPGSAAADDAGDGSFTGISCPTTTFCMAVSYLDGYSIYNGSNWSPMTETPADTTVGGDFHAVSCTSATFCAAEVDNFGDLAFYVHGHWEQPTTANNGIGIGQGSTPLSCVGTFCMYVNNGGQSQTSNDGTGLSAPVDIPGQTNELTSSVSCTSSTYCVAANTGAYTAAVWNGGGWTSTGVFVSKANVNLGLNAVSCVGTACAAADDSNVYSSNGGLAWSGPTLFDQHAEVTALSCASATFCVSGDYGGYAYVLNPLA
jgi:hypothetical protein